MNIQESTINVKKSEENSRFATLPSELQLKIKHYLQLGDFKTAKALYDQGLQLNDPR